MRGAWERGYFGALYEAKQETNTSVSRWYTSKTNCPRVGQLVLCVRWEILKFVYALVQSEKL